MPLSNTLLICAMAWSRRSYIKFFFFLKSNGVMRVMRGVGGSYEHLQLMATIFSALFFSALLLQDFFCY